MECREIEHKCYYESGILNSGFLDSDITSKKKVYLRQMNMVVLSCFVENHFMVKVVAVHLILNIPVGSRSII